MWAGAWVKVTRAQILDTAGRREDAEVLYREVVDAEAPHHSREAAEIAREGLAAPFTPTRPVALGRR